MCWADCSASSGAPGSMSPILWVAMSQRGKGHGAKLLSAAEDYASTRGAVGATLETYSFQAGPFYERLGYEPCGKLDGYPPGTQSSSFANHCSMPFRRFVHELRFSN